ncbi:TrmH family RNA methyltransferase [Aestuariivirga sp.]|uniref:TrmH family RNA methyltransferase n=1 Tax=Aestuariivirga sp. TaxID=2650926 RepID=UPI0039E71DDD
MPLLTSAQNPAIKAIRALAQKKHRAEQGLFVAEGEKVLARAKDMGWLPQTLVSTGRPPDLGQQVTLEVSPQVMATLSAQNNPPSLLAIYAQRWAEKVSQSGLWLALEDVRDPGNLGTILRTADAVGAEGVILAGNSCDPWGPDCVRATMGSIFAVPLLRMSVQELIALCRAWPGDCVGTHLEGERDYRGAYRSPALLVMGSEGAGLSGELAKACSRLVRIPMRQGPESLNLAIATGLMLYEIAKPK